MSDWQPIATVPLDTPVLITDGTRRYLAMLKTSKPEWTFSEKPSAQQATQNLNSVYAITPTHWMPIPPLPERP